MSETSLLPPPEIAVAQQLLDRSHRLGADRRNTNYAGGNTSAKGVVDDPIATEPALVMWVKGSGGDLGTLQQQGLSALRVDRLRALTGSYQGIEHEDDMVELMRLCLHGTGGAPPSIDTAMHGLLEFDHVDHLHPDSCLAIATAADGPELTQRCYGGRVVWVPWSRPGFQLGLDIARIARDNPDAVGCVLGGHGITAWGATSDECEQRSLWMVRTAAEFLIREGRPDPLGLVLPDRRPLEASARQRRARELFPLLRRLAGTDTPVVGAWDDSAEVLDFLSRAAMPNVASRGTSCPDHFIRTKVRPLIVDAPTNLPPAEVRARVAAAHKDYCAGYRAYYEEYADSGSPPMRGADPAVVLVPSVGMFTFGRDAANARLAGEFFVNAIHAMLGAESVSEYRPIPEREKFRIEYWSLEEAKLRRLAPPQPLSGRVVLVLGTVPVDVGLVAALSGYGASVVVAVPAAAPVPDVSSASVTDLPYRAGETVVAAVDRATLVYGGLDAVVVLSGSDGASTLAEAVGDGAGRRGLDIVMVGRPRFVDEAPEAWEGVRVHHITLEGQVEGAAVASAVVSVLTSAAARSELVLTE